MYSASDLWAYYADRRSVSVILTGGTIAKTYEPKTGGMQNAEPIIDNIVRDVRVDDLIIDFVDLMQIDSLQMNERDRLRLANTIQNQCRQRDALIVTHGTDTMMSSADAVIRMLKEPPIPVIFTGAMVPYVVDGSDAAQNITESLLASRLLPPGYFVVFHNRVLPLPGVEKDYQDLTFASRAV